MIDEILNKLSLEEKCSMLSRATFYYSQDIERLGIKGTIFADGPHGIRKQNEKADHLGLNQSVEATSFPPAVALQGSLWNEELIYQMGEALGVE